jgi:uncharacterized FlaG/YvyC family protein
MSRRATGTYCAVASGGPPPVAEPHYSTVLRKPRVSAWVRNRRDELDDAVTTLRNAAASARLDLDFRYDQDRSRIVVVVREAGGERVLRGLPREEALRLARLVRVRQQQLLDCLI